MSGQKKAFRRFISFMPVISFMIPMLSYVGVGVSSVKGAVPENAKAITFGTTYEEETSYNSRL